MMIISSFKGDTSIALGMPTNVKCDAEMSYSGRKQHDITITFKQTGNLRAFSTSADIVYNGKTTSGQISFLHQMFGNF
jgi:hypothetical protein